ncbi:peptide chain release factor N(5)-glutamine methyltransferase [Candidatus Parcubacteria bacterium]|nr:MAG: peptide chain release factor N(5)-glutamine methyltransferase [Candidatus Parcubacteria bacterium]
MASSQSQKTIKTILQKYAKKLEASELDQLLALALHKKVEYIYKHPEKKLNRSNIESFDKLIKKRLSGWSLAYLKGYKEFYGLKFFVSKYTLVPRPESEIIIDEALKYTTHLNSRGSVNARREKNQNIIDIGTGSGCLILSLAKNNKKEANYIAADISIKALQMAKTNARKLGLSRQIKFVKSNLFSKIKNKKFDIVIANLPYLTPQQMQEPSIKKEPRVALLAGKDGLSYYRKLLEQIPPYLKDKYLILLEIDPTQKNLINKVVEANLPKANTTFIKDLAGHTRIVKIDKN